MKNLNNDNIAQDQSHEDFFDRLPTAEEAERMEVEAGVTDTVAFNEQAVTALALAGMKNDLSLASVKPQTSSPRRKGRRVFRTVLIAAALAVLLATSLCVAAMIAYDVRFTQLIGLEGTMKELENGYVELGLTSEIDGLNISLVDAIGDSRTQWVEIRTNFKLPEGTPDGFFSNLTYEQFESMWILRDFDVSYYEGSLLETLKSDTDCKEYYYNTLLRKKGVPASCSFHIFARDGYLWYLVELTLLEDTNVNRGFVHMLLYFNTNNQKQWPVEFNWRNNYTAKEKTFRPNQKAGSVIVKQISLTSTKMYISYDGVRSGFCLNSVTLSDGTVIPVQTSDQDPDGWDGWIDNGINYSKDLYYRNYSLVPGKSFKTPADMTALIPADDIVSVTVNGVKIKLR
ncbi:MAG: hypothetical protein J5643_07625 [Lachnospiraceae bacterium]|nr:hypothetical protein [Lachnospiraceae bacterium]